MFDFKFENVKQENSCYVRKATLRDMDDIFRMGRDVWGVGITEEQHIAKCHASKKYPLGQWYVMEDADNKLLSSAIVYPFPAFKESKAVGFGTIATPPKLRKQGYASRFISELIYSLSCIDDVKIFYLYSDISPCFYEKFGFEVLPEKMQRHLPSQLMVHCEASLREKLLSDKQYIFPEYF